MIIKQEIRVSEIEIQNTNRNLLLVKRNKAPIIN